MMIAPYTARDMAAICGVSLDRFYKNRCRYEKIDGMPQPYRRGCWDRASVDAWRMRNHPAAPKHRPANDAAPVPMPNNDQQWNDYLRKHYAPEQA